MKCPNCPVAATRSCLGESVSRLCELARTRVDYRRQLVRLAGESFVPVETPRVDLDAALKRVSRCRERGAVLPPSLQPACGCAELTECRAGRGDPPGRVTLQDCLACATSGGRGSTEIQDGPETVA